MQVHVQPELLHWARERAALSADDLAAKLALSPAHVHAWERTGDLTLAQLETLAGKTHTPVGYLFLPAPPDEPLPIPDFRTLDGGAVARPSPDLLATIYLCQRRQAWYRAYLVEEGEAPLPFVGSARLTDSVEDLAASMRETLGLDREARSALPTWEEALRQMVERVEAAGILVMRNGVVGNNTRRKLSVAEFRGFVLTDEYAPLVFINGADARAAQMFTLAHEVAHIWLGQSGVSDARIASANATERFCNRVAAELLVPMGDFRAQWQPAAEPGAEARRLARRYKVSALTLLIRAREAAALSAERFAELYAAEQARERDTTGAGGGDFYRLQTARIGRRFARAVITSALEGETLYRDALGLLGLKKMETFHRLASALGVAHG